MFPRLITQDNQPSLAAVIANGMLFNISWLAIVYSHSPLFAPIVATLHLLVHFALMGRGFVEARLILGVSVLGFALDQAIFAAGVLTASGPYSVAPIWISCLWPVLATTLMHAFSSLQKRLLLAAVIGGVGGTASYLGGARLSDVEFVSQFWGPFTMALIWFAVFPLLLLAARLNSESDI